MILNGVICKNYLEVSIPILYLQFTSGIVLNYWHYFFLAINLKMIIIKLKILYINIIVITLINNSLLLKFSFMGLFQERLVDALKLK